MQTGDETSLAPARKLDIYDLARKLQKGAEIKDRRWALRKHKQCFVGQDAVDHMLATKMAPTREAAVNLGQQMVACGLFQHVCNDHDFEDKYYFYRFNEQNMALADVSPQFIKKISGRFPTEEEMRAGGLIQNRRWFFVKWSQCFVGRELVSWMIKHGFASDTKEAVRMGQNMMAADRIAYRGCDLGLSAKFDNGPLFYKWVKVERMKDADSTDVFASVKHVSFPLKSAQCCQTPALQVTVPEQIHFLWNTQQTNEWLEQLQKAMIHLDSAPVPGADKSTPRKSVVYSPLIPAIMELGSMDYHRVKKILVERFGQDVFNDHKTFVQNWLRLTKPPSYHRVKAILVERFGQDVFDDHKNVVQNWLRLSRFRDELSRKVADGQQGDSINNELLVLYARALRTDLKTIKIAQQRQRQSQATECEGWDQLKEYLQERGWGEVLSRFSRVHRLVIERIGMLDAYAQTMYQALEGELARVDAHLRGGPSIAISSSISSILSVTATNPSATANLTANSSGTTSGGISPTDSSTSVSLAGSQCEREPTRPPPPPPPPRPGKKTTANTSWVINPPTGYKSASETLLKTTTKKHTVATAATAAPTASDPNRLEQKNHSVTTAATAAPTAPNHPNRLEELLEEVLEQSFQALLKATSNLKDLGAALDEHRSAPRLQLTTNRPRSGVFKEARACVFGRVAILLPMLVKDDHCDLFVKSFSSSWTGSHLDPFDSEKRIRRLSFYALASEHASGAGRCIFFFLRFLPHLPINTPAIKPAIAPAKSPSLSPLRGPQVADSVSELFESMTLEPLALSVIDEQPPSRKESSASYRRESSASNRRDSSASNRRDSSASNRRDSSASNRRDSSASNRRDSSASNRRDSSASNRRESSVSYRRDSRARTPSPTDSVGSPILFSLSTLSMFANYVSALLLSNAQLPYSAKDLHKASLQGPSKRKVTTTHEKSEKRLRRTASYSAVVWALSQQLFFQRIQEACPEVLELPEEEKKWEDRWQKQSRALADSFPVGSSSDSSELLELLGVKAHLIPVKNCKDSDRWYGEAVDTLIKLSSIIECLRTPKKDLEQSGEDGFNVSIILHTLLEVMKRIHEAAKLNGSDHGKDKPMGAEEFTPLLIFVCIRSQHKFTSPHFVLWVLDQLMLSPNGIRPPPCCDGIAVPSTLPMAIPTAGTKSEKCSPECQPLIECWTGYRAVVSEASYYCTVLRSAVGFICCSSVKHSSVAPTDDSLRERRRSIVAANATATLHAPASLSSRDWISVASGSETSPDTLSPNGDFSRIRAISRSRFPTEAEMRAAGILIERERWKVSANKEHTSWFVGKTLVAWMVAQGLAPDKETAVRMGQGQLQRGYILSSGYQFQDASIFYQLCQGAGASTPRLQHGSLRGIRSKIRLQRSNSLGTLEECSSRVLSTSAPTFNFLDRALSLPPDRSLTSDRVIPKQSQVTKRVLDLDEDMFGQYHEETLELTISRERESKKQTKRLKTWVKLHKSEWTSY